MSLQRFPGFIDIHVHLRDPGATQKEDFRSGSRAALTGGFTYIVDMPNNPTCPTISEERLEDKIKRSAKAACDIGFHYGTDGNNCDSFPHVWSNPHVFGLKIYCNETTGELLVNDEKKLDCIFTMWNSDKPILVHAEKSELALCLQLAKTYNRRLHVCHVANNEMLLMIRRAKEMKQSVTAGVTPHHVFLKEACVKPSIGRQDDQDALWEGLQRGTIDLVESDHAPHTIEDKKQGAYGVPGLETTVGLLLKKDKKCPLVTWLYENPKTIFSIPNQPDTYIELDPDKAYIAGSEGYETKCGWSPFDGWELYGRVEKVILYGKSIY